MHPLSPLQGEVYYLRCLLLMVPGPTSFEDLRTVDGVRHDTFENACYARGIITRDNEWELCFDEASHFQTGWYLRRLLISAMVYGGLADASSIWEKFGDVLREELTYKICQKRLFCDPSIDRPDLDYDLFLIYKDLLNEEVDYEQGPLAKYNLPNFQNNWETDQHPNTLSMRERHYDRE